MVCSTDGFEIAEEDLKLRGPGDLEGTRQSGVAFEFRIANLARDGAILQQARDAASAIIQSDPTYSNPVNSRLWEQLRLLRKTHINWSAIS
jgi:ATP-dependent DNA helicase RecG